MKLFKILFYFILGTAAVFLGSEILLSVVSRTGFGKILPLPEPLLGQPDGAIGYALTPLAEGMWTRENRAYVRINSLGLRDREMVQEKPPGVYRVAVLGDSVTEAFQVENERTFENLAEDSLVQKGHKVEIVNLAMSGNGPLRQLVRLENNGLALSPDMAVFMFPAEAFLSGEIFDDTQNPGYKYNSSGQLMRSYGYRNRISQRYKDTFIGEAFFFLIKHSHVLRALNMKRKEPILKFLGVSAPSLSFFKAQGNADIRDECPGSHFRESYDLWIHHQPAQAWDGVVTFTRELFSVARKNKIDVMMALQLPLADEDCAADRKYRDATIAKMRGYFVGQGFFFVDWSAGVAQSLDLPPYKSPTISQLNGFGLNLTKGHLNYRGHEVYARTLEKTLARYLKH